EVVEAIVIVVADGDAGGPNAAAETGFFGNVGEGTVAVIAIEPDGRAVGCGVEPAPGEEKDVEPAVVIVVQKGDTAAHGFESEIGVSRSAVNDGGAEPGLLRDVDEAGVEGEAGSIAERDRFDVGRRHLSGSGRG